MLALNDFLKEVLRTNFFYRHVPTWTISLSVVFSTDDPWFTISTGKFSTLGVSSFTYVTQLCWENISFKYITNFKQDISSMQTITWFLCVNKFLITNTIWLYRSISKKFIGVSNFGHKKHYLTIKYDLNCSADGFDFEYKWTVLDFILMLNNGISISFVILFHLLPHNHSVYLLFCKFRNNWEKYCLRLLKMSFDLKRKSMLSV